MIKNNMDALLEKHGYVIVENVLTERQVDKTKTMFHEWYSNPEINLKHAKTGVHGIFKYGEAAHQRFAWYVKTRDSVQQVFRDIWKTDDLVTGFDGSCYLPSTFQQKDTCWIHTDQAPNKKGRTCIQGFVALTTNIDRTLVVYDGSHLLHEEYMRDYKETGSKNWIKIDKSYLERIADRKRVLHVKAGSLVLWDSRTFHSNQYGTNGEERLVQYTCFLPRHHEKNNAAMKEKRLKYFNERRMTSHWPYPLHVNSLQPHTFGNDNLLIDYSKLIPPNLKRLGKKIKCIL
jgi:ectoine hydroxylase-related dioxygenase (phytanoyl-CoA dioxygenase family)